MHRPLRLTIDRSAIQSNWRWLQDRAGVPAGAAVKADGYGLGARETTRGADRGGLPRLFRFDLGRGGGARQVAGGAPAGRAPRRRARTTSRRRCDFAARPCLNTVEQVARWKEIAPGRAVRRDDRHRHQPARAAARRDRRADGLTIETLHSHLACADEDMPLNAMQLERFRAVAAAVPAKRYSLANSAGICLGRDYSFDLVRPGPGALRRRSARRGRGQHPPGRAGRGADRPAPDDPAQARPAATARPSPPARTPRPRSSTSVTPTAICAASRRVVRRSPANLRCRCSGGCRWT